MAIDEYNNFDKSEIVNDSNGSNGIKQSYWIENKNIILTSKQIGTDYSYKHQKVWKNIIGFLILHIFAIWGLLVVVTGNIKLQTYIWTIFLLFISSEGVTIGAHRFFAHRSFKATPLLKVIFLFCQTMAGQNCVYIWSRDHRLHHRYSDTDADPHNSKRGFFFCHIGWLMMKKHPYVKELGKRIDMSDLEADWMVMFQMEYYYILYFFIAFLIPVIVPYYYFGETLKNALLVCYFFRYMSQLHGTWLVNSAAHLYGTRPYDKKLQPVESAFVSFISLGEGWHNYHHTFPWDYKAAELSTHYNQSAYFIEIFEKLGLAFDLKTASPQMVANRIIRTGDGTHYSLGNDEARSSVTAVGPVHPLNPSYNVKYRAPEATLQDQGLPLFHETDVFSSAVLKKNTATA